MRRLCVLLLACVPVLSQAREAAILHVDRSDAGALQSALVDLAQQELQAAGLVLDREHVWLNVSGALPTTDEIEVLPTWSSVAGMPVLPLTFELRSRTNTPAPRSVRATLAVRLQRAAWVTQRRLRKGSHVSCSDLAVELRDVREVQSGSLQVPCDIEPDISALRDIAAGEVLRTRDIGRAPDVQIGVPVQVTASSGGIDVTTTAIALADARVGDQIDVRLQRPRRTLRTRVVGRGAVQLMDDVP
jgi:flagella basal body P-ring formation protein FlgA